MISKVDQFFDKAKTWNLEMLELRKIILECDLNEDLKWRLPCYMLNDSNVVIIQPFKDYCAILFFKGSLLKDSKKILKAPGNSQAARQIRFTSTKEITKLKATIKSYIQEAIKIDESGEKVVLKKTADFKVPEEFQKHLDKNKKLKKAFDSLTPGRQRGYLHFFSSAKQSATREARVMKCQDMILQGLGLND